MCIPMLCVQSAHAENQTDADLNTRTSSEGGAHDTYRLYNADGYKWARAVMQPRN